MERKEFYVQLGKLLYSVAMADGQVQDEEIQALYKMVINDLSDETLFNQQEVNVFHTEFEFEDLMDRKVSRQEALESFLKYFDENHNTYTPEMRKVTIYAMEQIAKSFDGIIPEELAIIEDLKQRMEFNN